MLPRVSAEVRWADLDPNVHMLHSRYYDLGAYARMHFFNQYGLTLELLKATGMGPVIFREECVFKREITFGDRLEIDFALLRARRDNSRWSIRNRIYKQTDILAAVIHIDGAWINQHTRKLAIPPEALHQVFQHFPKDDTFEWDD